MEYLDGNLLIHKMKSDNHIQNFLNTASREVEEYFETFHDDPAHISRWAHHYFCPEEGGLLIYNSKSPTKHKCSICGKVYSNDLLNGAWLTMYRNEGVMNVWKCALLFKVKREPKYLEHIIFYTQFYAQHYEQFLRHNKEGHVFENGVNPEWGCSRIMPQNLNEAIFLTRLVNALEMVKASLSKGFLQEIEEKLFIPSFHLLKSQVHRIHNIPSWINCALGVMGLFLENKDMIDFVFLGEYNINRQLKEGVTEDYFWYEGSIHYNSFLLEGLVNLLLFSNLKSYDFPYGKSLIEKMLLSLYDYAFDDHRLPNPNDGWPDVNLKTYSYIYAMAVKVYGEESPVGKRMGSILNHEGERGTIPLSKPYYVNNDISLEEIIFAPELRARKQEIILRESRNFKSSFCAMIRSGKSNLFLKYGHNGPSHAHPDKMNVEVVLDGVCLSRDLSNSGYGNQYCNEWHRVSASHNTVVINGQNQSGFGKGICLIDKSDHIKAYSENVYGGVTFDRDVIISPSGWQDTFTVRSEEESTCDYFFHVEGQLHYEAQGVPAELGFIENGYQYIKNIKQIKLDNEELSFIWNIKGRSFESIISVVGKELFLAKTPDNPVTKHRTTIIIRQKGKNIEFKSAWNIL